MHHTDPTTLKVGTISQQKASSDQRTRRSYSSNKNKENIFDTLQQWIDVFEKTLTETLKHCTCQVLNNQCSRQYKIIRHYLSHFLYSQIENHDRIENCLELKYSMIKRLKKAKIDKQNLQKEVEDVYKTMRVNLLKKDAQMQQLKEEILRIRKESPLRQHQILKIKTYQENDAIKTLQPNQKRTYGDFSHLSLNTKEQFRGTTDNFHPFLLVQALSIENLLNA